ncbi:MAG: patatin-like phospholipase family protein [Polyangiaceae bacterium]|nr:patatin-like phospholipase family protein [Polyangiaceae bacterium]
MSASSTSNASSSETASASTGMDRIALSLPGGGISGALYQVGALAALEDGIEGIGNFGTYIGHAGGAVVAACLAGGISANRLYRALLDPADPFFPLERRHVLAFDTFEWQRMLKTAYLAFRHAVPRLDPRRASPTPVGIPDRIVEEIDRLEDSLPAGIFTLDRFERVLAEFYERREIGNVFRALPRRLRVIAYDLDSGARAVFGSKGFEQTPISLACAASCAVPLFFSPVRIGQRHYIEGGLCSMTHFDVARDNGAQLTIVVNPRVPVSTRGESIPTGHGVGQSVRDKGLLWVLNQSRRIASQAMLESEVAHPPDGMSVLRIEPHPEDAVLFLKNTRSFEARRIVLEHAYRTTRARLATWLEAGGGLAALGLRAR